MAPRELVRDAVERVVLSGHGGNSGAGLERVRPADRRALIVKRIEPGAEHPDADVRAREPDDLEWWVRQSRAAREEGVL